FGKEVTGVMGHDRRRGRFVDLDQSTFEGEVELERALEAMVWLVGQGAGDDSLQNVWCVLGEWRWTVAARELVERCDLVCAVVRRLAREQLVKDGPESPHVGAVIHRASKRLLGRHITDLALELPSARVLRDPITRLGDSKVDDRRRTVVPDE